jgi:hypothetical protein
MNEEMPMANPPLTAEEKSVAAKLSDADVQAIDATILANSSDRWYKVARVVGSTEDALKLRYPGLSYVFYAHRLCQLVDERRLDSQGDVLYMRFSEVRLPMQSNSGDESQHGGSVENGDCR